MGKSVFKYKMASQHEILSVIKEAIKNTTYCTNSVFTVVSSDWDGRGTEVQDASLLPSPLPTNPRHDDDVKMHQWRPSPKSELGEDRGEECFESARGPRTQINPRARGLIQSYALGWEEGTAVSGPSRCMIES